MSKNFKQRLTHVKALIKDLEKRRYDMVKSVTKVPESMIRALQILYNGANYATEEDVHNCWKEYCDYIYEQYPEDHVERQKYYQICKIKKQSCQ